MVLYPENTRDASLEKHVPVITRNGNELKVDVGQELHPMEEEHYIEWIEVIAGEKICRQFLKADQAPEAVFQAGVGKITVRAFCNLHGLWKVEV